MKHRYLVITLAIFFIASFANAQTWKKVTSPSMSVYSDSYFIDANNGWLVGTKGSIMKTADGGKTWSTVTTTITEDLKSVYFLNATTGFIASPTKLYKSTNGFSTYTTVDITGAIVTTSGYWTVYFADSQKGWFLSSSSSAAKVLQTVDGGTTWTVGVDHKTGNLQTIKFYNASAGIVAGGGSGKCDIYYTKDGATWTKGTAPAFPAGVYTRTDIRSLYLIDANTAIGGGWGSSAAGLQPTIFIKTTDGGATWTYLGQKEENKTYEYAYELVFKNATTGLAAGGATKTPNFMKTVDGGLNWTQLPTPFGYQISRLFSFGDNVIAVTNSSAIYKSADFGTSWEAVTPVPNSTLTKLFAFSDDVVYAGGQKGLIMKTTDGGKNWKALSHIANNVCLSINGLFFLTKDFGFSATSYGGIAKTSDGGATWVSLKKDTSAATVTNNSVVFTTSTTGFVAGQLSSSIDIIYKTVDAGTTWTVASKGVAAASLNSIAFGNTQVGAAVGAKLKILYTKDGGTTWALATTTGVPTAQATATLNSVTFLSGTEAIAVGDKVTLKSNDGGQTWTYVALTTTQTLNGVAFLNNNAWAIGAKSSSPKSIGVWKSIDKGATWTNNVNYAVFDTASTTYNDVAVTNSGAVFVCGAATGIYTNSTTVDISDQEELPATFELMQNYPNPFNPETTINYSLNKAGMVRLNVYDVLGREVKSLVNVNQMPGRYSVKFDGSNLSSGIYFYSISTGNSILTKKMILIK